jgi:hypothetical protein
MGKNEAEGENDFSIIFGTRRLSDERPGKQKPKPKSPKEPAEKKAPKKESLDELLKKREEIELFLTSLEDARLNSKMPEYAYERLKKKSEVDLKNVGERIKKGGYKHVKREGESLEMNISEVRSAIASLKGEKRIDTGYNQSRPDKTRLKEFEKKLNELSESLQNVSKRLSKRIDEVAVADDVEITENVRRLKKEIDSLRSCLSEFVRKTDLSDFLLRTTMSLAAAEHPTVRKESVDIKRLSGFVGKTVTVECGISLFKSVERGKAKIYWYRIEDGTGRTILTSYEKIGRKKAKIVGDVKKTKSGSAYLVLRKIL